MVRVIGVDPGLRFTGWGVIAVEGNRLRHVADGVIAIDAGAGVPERLKALHQALAALIAEYRPDEAAVEETYVNRNGTATLRLGYARGVALLAPALAGIPVLEYAATAVKRAVVGTGRAEKQQVQLMVRRLLPGAAIRRADAADALAVAICHAHHRASQIAWGGRISHPMIAKLTGRVEAIEPDRCVVDVGGVGYLVLASSRTLAALPAPPALAQLLIETQVREDAIVLYGFADASERDWFRLLTTVQGVGAKVALSILSTLSPRELAGAIATGERAALTRAPGVGPRLAVRLLTELRDRAATIPCGAAFAVPAKAPSGAEADALSALVNLGYRRTEAQGALERAARRLGGAATLDALIRDSLKELAQ